MHTALHSLKWRNPSEWSIVSNLMCDKLNAPVWSIIQAVFKKVTQHTDYKSDNVDGHGNFNQQVLHLDPRVQEEELKQIFGIQV